MANVRKMAIVEAMLRAIWFSSPAGSERPGKVAGSQPADRAGVGIGGGGGGGGEADGVGFPSGRRNECEPFRELLLAGRFGARGCFSDRPPVP